MTGTCVLHLAPRISSAAHVHVHAAGVPHAAYLHPAQILLHTPRRGYDCEKQVENMDSNMGRHDLCPDCLPAHFICRSLFIRA